MVRSPPALAGFEIGLDPADDTRVVGYAESELKVAELVSAGLTNRAVARTLHISINTVGTHLRSVFTKLDVQSRVQLTNALHGARLESPSGRRREDASVRFARPVERGADG